MDEKLLKFRKDKARQKFKEDLKTKFGQFVSSISKFSKPVGMTNISIDTCIEPKENPPSDTKQFSYIKFSIWFSLWLLAFMFFIYIQFGAVYFCVTALCFIYFNTRTGGKAQNEISAYSVFNENCEVIDGTFTAEQFDKQVRSGMF